jgi:hypothetical protein
MSATKANEKGDLVPFRTTTIDLAYGGMEYARSVFGRENITRSDLIDYIDNAKLTWSKIDYPFGIARYNVVDWCKAHGIGPLHYVAPMGYRIVWFKEETDAFAFSLQFGII